MFYYTASNPAQLANFPFADMFILYVFSLMACINNFFCCIFYICNSVCMSPHGGGHVFLLEIMTKKISIYKFFHFALPSLIVLTFPSTKHFQRYEGSSLHAITLNKCTNKKLSKSTKLWSNVQTCLCRRANRGGRRILVVRPWIRVYQQPACGLWGPATRFSS